MKKIIVMMLLCSVAPYVSAAKNKAVIKSHRCAGWTVIVNGKLLDKPVKNGRKWRGNVIWEHNPRKEIIGTNGPDMIVVTGTVNAKIRAMGGDDLICGGEGNDFINGNQGNDIIYGRGGNDTLRGGKHNDTLYGGKGRNKLYGDLGNDQCFNNSGRDEVKDCESVGR